MARKKREMLLTEKVQIRLPMNILKKLDDTARPRLISRSDVIREAILGYLKDRKESR